MVAICFMTDGNGSYHRLAPSFFEEMTRCRRQTIAGDDQTTLMVHRNSANIACTFRIYVCAIATVVPRLTLAAVDTHPHRRISKRWHVADIKNFTGDDQTNPSGRSKFRNLGLFMFTPDGDSAANGGFRRSLKRHVANVKNIAGDD